MIRVLVYLVVLAIFAYVGMLVVENPGHVTLTWHSTTVSTYAALLVLAVAVAAIVAWSVLRLLFGLPGFVSVFARQRRREKGYAALSRGLIAVGSGDAREANRAATQAERALKNDPLAIMLRAQAAHLNGDEDEARSAFEALAQRPETRVLGLRGLHAEASRRGDDEAALHFASAAHQAAPLPWSAQAVLEHRAAVGDWEKALATVETSIAAKLVDKETGERQRAVLETAIAYDKETAAPNAALALAKAAMRRAPDLAPPVVLAARLMSRQGEIRKAAKLIEKAWPVCQHPDIARAYLDVRPGDSTGDRLERAKTLMGIASFDSVSRLTVARAALAAKDFTTARKAMAPLVGTGQQPSVRTCLLMAELEEAEHGDRGSWREWLARSSHASLDPAWIADGKVYDHWAPVSPVTGKLDAFRWQVPAERLGPAMDAMPEPAPKPAVSTAQVTPVLSHAGGAADGSSEGQGERGVSQDASPTATLLPTPSVPKAEPPASSTSEPGASEPGVSEPGVIEQGVIEQGVSEQGASVGAPSPRRGVPELSNPPLIEAAANEALANEALTNEASALDPVHEGTGEAEPSDRREGEAGAAGARPRTAEPSAVGPAAHPGGRAVTKSATRQPAILTSG